MPVWASDVNADDVISDFASEVAKETPTEGSWEADYLSISKKLKVVPCPFVSKISETRVRAYNCFLDISSWRCALLACLTLGSTVSEVVLNGCEVTPQHLRDLYLALEKLCGQVRVLKIEYLTFPRGTEEDARREAFRKLLSGDIRVEYVSFQGDNLDDSLIQSAAVDIQQNYALKALNLSDNNLTDPGLAELFKSLRANVSLIELSVSRNKITGDGSFSELVTLLTGSIASPEDDTAIKEITKIVAEKNKIIKDLNKKRKKAGQTELSEISSSSRDRVVKLDGKFVLANRSILTVDLSRNPLKADYLTDGITLLREKAGEATLTTSFGSFRTTALLTQSTPDPDPLILPAQDITALQEAGINIVV